MPTAFPTIRLSRRFSSPSPTAVFTLIVLLYITLWALACHASRPSAGGLPKPSVSTPLKSEADSHG